MQAVGIRGLDLTYALMEPHDLVILVDACPRGGEPGTLYLVEPDHAEWNNLPMTLDTHSMHPMNVLRAVVSMGGSPGRILIVGCEPADIGTDEEGKFGLSEPVAQAVGEAVRMIETLVEQALEGEQVKPEMQLS